MTLEVIEITLFLRRGGLTHELAFIFLIIDVACYLNYNTNLKDLYLCLFSFTFCKGLNSEN